MSFEIQPVDYFYTTVQDQPGEAYKLLSILEERAINLLAFTAVPVGSNRTQLALFPEDPRQLLHEAKQTGLALEGPHQALMVQGDDELGALVEIHRQLYEAGVNIYASSGLSDGKGSFGYLIYVRAEEFEAALQALKI